MLHFENALPEVARGNDFRHAPRRGVLQLPRVVRIGVAHRGFDLRHEGVRKIDAVVEVQGFEVLVARGLSHLDERNDVRMIDVEKRRVRAATGRALTVRKARRIVDLQVRHHAHALFIRRADAHVDPHAAPEHREPIDFGERVDEPFGAVGHVGEEAGNRRRLEALGIRCKVFAPVTPFVSTHYNYRDHRKILVVDGRVGFTGGVNLADEYINHVEKYGRWKDAAVMLEGEGVRTMTALFLQMWSIQREPEFAQFLTRPLPETQATGFVIPYGDCPLDGERVGEMVYIDLLNRARHSVHIITPYLILDGELETALRFAAERGVDVHLILPGKPDKWFAYALAKTHYLPLLSSGVKISEWTPGFTHAKVMIMDGQEAVVGTINLDYRSLYHHFENAVWMRGVDCLPRIEADFQDTLAQCRTVEPTRQSVWQGKKLLHLVGIMLKFIAPLI